MIAGRARPSSAALLHGLLWLGGVAGTLGCHECSQGGSDAGGATVVEGDVVVTGTVLDGATGDVLGGVKLEGPSGTRAVSRTNGRFELRGLAEGDQGVLVGSLEDGRRGEIPLRPLEPGRMEVVLRLRSSSDEKQGVNQDEN